MGQFIQYASAPIYEMAKDIPGKRKCNTFEESTNSIIHLAIARIIHKRLQSGEPFSFGTCLHVLKSSQRTGIGLNG